MNEEKPLAEKSKVCGRKMGPNTKQPYNDYTQLGFLYLEKFFVEEEVDEEGESDTEMLIHKRFKIDAVICKKGSILCLDCYLKNARKGTRGSPLLTNDRMKSHYVAHHGGAGMQCKKKDCLVRATNQGDIGAHELYGH